MITRILRSICQLAAVATLISSVNAGDTVPLRTRTAGSVVSKTYFADPASSPLGTPFLYVTAKAVGVGNQIGKYTIDLAEVFHLAFMNGNVTLVSVGTYVATAANGDQIFGTYQNYRAPGSLTFTGVSEITGGTGRFEGASGFETTVGEISPNLIDFTYEHEGYMTSVGSLVGKGH